MVMGKAARRSNRGVLEETDSMGYRGMAQRSTPQSVLWVHV